MRILRAVYVNERDELRNWMDVQGRLHHLRHKRQVGVYPFQPNERAMLEGPLPTRNAYWLMRICQHCGDVFRVWTAELETRDQPVSCNLCAIAPKWRSER